MREIDETNNEIHGQINVEFPIHLISQGPVGKVDLSEINVYLYKDGTYTGQNGVTDQNGIVKFLIQPGKYSVRADLLGYQFMSDEFDVSSQIMFYDFCIQYTYTFVTAQTKCGTQYS